MSLSVLLLLAPRPLHTPLELVDEAEGLVKEPAGPPRSRGDAREDKVPLEAPDEVMEQLECGLNDVADDVMDEAMEEEGGSCLGGFVGEAVAASPCYYQKKNMYILD